MPVEPFSRRDLGFLRRLLIRWVVFGVHVYGIRNSCANALCKDVSHEAKDARDEFSAVEHAEQHP